jgi:hypothetical protein
MRLPTWLSPWRDEIVTVNTLLHTQCDRGSDPWLNLVRHPYAYNRRAMPAFLKHALLHDVQDGRCVWCHKHVATPHATIEHVIPFDSALWPQMTPLEQLLSLRVSHDTCNHRYATLRRNLPRWALAQDLWRWRAIQQVLSHDPYWACWIPHYSIQKEGLPHVCALS